MRPTDPTQYTPGSYDHEFDDPVNQPIDDSIFDEGTFPLASPWRRLAAVGLDGLIAFGVALPGLILVGIGGDTNSEALGAMGGLALLVMLGGLFVYQILLLSRDGQTIGKRVLKLRIVDEHDGSNPGFARAFLIRSVLMGILGLVPFVNLIDALMIFSEDHKTLHDRLATTLVEDESRGAW